MVFLKILERQRICVSWYRTDLAPEQFNDTSQKFVHQLEAETEKTPYQLVTFKSLIFEHSSHCIICFMMKACNILQINLDKIKWVKNIWHLLRPLSEIPDYSLVVMLKIHNYHFFRMGIEKRFHSFHTLDRMRF